MAKKKLGYVELYWECPNCGTINPGAEKVCKGCAAPQPDDIEFFQASEQQLIEDKAKLERAKAGADIHCAYCGARNPAGASSCSQCMADLSEGSKRKSGRVVGAFKGGAAKQVACPHCGAQNPEPASACSQCGGSMASVHKKAEDVQPEPKRKVKPGSLAGLAVILLAACAAIYFIFLRTSAETGVVTGVEWERSVALEAIVPVEYEGWWDEIPDEGEILSCTQEERGETDQPTEGAMEVCGTPYNVDQGSGYAEVVQDCVYVIMDDFCSYTMMEWDVVETLTLTGDDYDAAWPDPFLAQDERLGEGTETESYTIFFDVDGETYSHVTEDYDLLMKAQPGTTWELEINSIGGVQSISQ
jgi:ribosomal protein L40E